MKPTTVVHIKKEAYDVYIGRAGHGQDGTFGNPHERFGRLENIRRFKTYFYDRIKNDRAFANKVIKLRGKRLGCFCRPEKACHGDVIAEYLDSLPEPNPLKLGVIGSRTFHEYNYLKKMLSWFEIKIIISGGAKGADSLARKYALEQGIVLKEFPAEWDKYGKSAGYRRNVDIVEASDEIIAFWDKISRGTKHSIDIATEKGKPIHVYKAMYKDSEGNPLWEDDLGCL